MNKFACYLHGKNLFFPDLLIEKKRSGRAETLIYSLDHPKQNVGTITNQNISIIYIYLCLYLPVYLFIYLSIYYLCLFLSLSLSLFFSLYIYILRRRYFTNVQSFSKIIKNTFLNLFCKYFRSHFGSHLHLIHNFCCVRKLRTKSSYDGSVYEQEQWS